MFFTLLMTDFDTIPFFSFKAWACYASLQFNKVSCMNWKSITLILLILMSQTLHARSVERFTEGLQELLHFSKKGRAKELEKSLNLAPLNKLDKLLSPTASATYNGKLNTIKLDEKLVLKQDGRFLIKSPIEIFEKNLEGMTEIVTIFHELAHAELDLLVENNKGLNDVILMGHYKNSLKEIIKRNFTYDSWTFFHEYVAYYRTDLAETYFWDKQDIYFNNGYDPRTNKCRQSAMVKKMLAEKVSLDEFTKFYAFDLEKNYKKIVAPKYVFVKGKDYNLDSLSKAEQAVIIKTNDLFWMYHSEEYGVPGTQKELVSRMNQNDRELNAFKKCRTEIYRQYFN